MKRTCIGCGDKVSEKKQVFQGYSTWCYPCFDAEGQRSAKEDVSGKTRIGPASWGAAGIVNTFKRTPRYMLDPGPEWTKEGYALPQCKNCGVQLDHYDMTQGLWLDRHDFGQCPRSSAHHIPTYPSSTGGTVNDDTKSPTDKVLEDEFLALIAQGQAEAKAQTEHSVPGDPTAIPDPVPPEAPTGEHLTQLLQQFGGSVTDGPEVQVQDKYKPEPEHGTFVVDLKADALNKYKAPTPEEAAEYASHVQEKLPPVATVPLATINVGGQQIPVELEVEYSKLTDDELKVEAERIANSGDLTKTEEITKELLRREFGLHAEDAIAEIEALVNELDPNDTAARIEAASYIIEKLVATGTGTGRIFGDTQGIAQDAGASVVGHGDIAPADIEALINQKIAEALGQGGQATQTPVQNQPQTFTFEDVLKQIDPRDSEAALAMLDWLLQNQRLHRVGVLDGGQGYLFVYSEPKGTSKAGYRPGATQGDRIVDAAVEQQRAHGTKRKTGMCPHCLSAVVQLEGDEKIYLDDDQNPTSTCENGPNGLHELA